MGWRYYKCYRCYKYYMNSYYAYNTYNSYNTYNKKRSCQTGNLFDLLFYILATQRFTIHRKSSNIAAPDTSPVRTPNEMSIGK